jgi:N-methylhydantoinase A
VILPTTEAGEKAAPRGVTREAYFPEAGGYVETAVYRRSDLSAGAIFTGPALVEDAESTVVLPPGDVATVDPARHLFIEVSAADAEGGRT